MSYYSFYRPTEGRRLSRPSLCDLSHRVLLVGSDRCLCNDARDVWLHWSRTVTAPPHARRSVVMLAPVVRRSRRVTCGGDASRRRQRPDLSLSKCDTVLSRAVIFNRDSAEPQGSASICQSLGFRSWPVKNNSTSEVTPDKVVENQQIALLCVYFCIDYCV